jgi:short-subunit dehydrogenase
MRYARPVPDLHGKTALVTGASSGIGAAMARRLASWGCGVVLTARRLERLEALAAELTGAHGVPARAVREDLSDPAGAERLYRAATARGPLDIVVNNAGIAAFERVVECDWERHRAILQLDVVSLCELTWRFARDMVERGERGYVLNIASTAAIAPVRGFAIYGAAKAFVLNFSQALAAELAATRVTVTAATPGPVATEFMDTAGMHVSAFKRHLLYDAERCAEVALRGMLRGRRVVVPGLLAKVMMYGSRLGPSRLNGAVGSLVLGTPPEGGKPAAAIGKPADGK